MDELIRKPENSPYAEPENVHSANGFPMFPHAEGTVTSEMIKKLDEEELAADELD